MVLNSDNTSTFMRVQTHPSHTQKHRFFIIFLQPSLLVFPLWVKLLIVYLHGWAASCMLYTHASWFYEPCFSNLCLVIFALALPGTTQNALWTHNEQDGEFSHFTTAAAAACVWVTMSRQDRVKWETRDSPRIPDLSARVWAGSLGIPSSPSCASAVGGGGVQWDWGRRRNICSSVTPRSLALTSYCTRSLAGYWH